MFDYSELAFAIECGELAFAFSYSELTFVFSYSEPAFVFSYSELMFAAVLVTFSDFSSDGVASYPYETLHQLAHAPV